MKQMGLDLSNYDELAREAVRYFWRSRASARVKQKESGKSGRRHSREKYGRLHLVDSGCHTKQWVSPCGNPQRADRFDVARFLSTDEALGSSGDERRKADRGHRIEKSGRTIFRK